MKHDARAERAELGDIGMIAAIKTWVRRVAGIWARSWGPPKVLMAARAPIRPIVIIQSDDWGRVGIPSMGALDEIRKAGFQIGESPWDRYGLESADDIDQFVATLAGFRDTDGRVASVTVNFVMANADFRRMAAEGWKKFYWRSIDEGFPPPWDEDLMPSYRRAMEAGVFYPALHGFTHFNATGLMAALNDPGDLGLRARTLAQADVPYFRSLTPEYNFALVKCDADGERFLDPADQSEWIDRSVQLFEKAFGFRPISACAPGYRENDVTRKLFGRAGIAVIQGRYGDIPLEEDGLLFLGRNVAFEPCLQAEDAVASAMAEASQAVAAGAPIVICTHSINYVSRFLGRAEFARGELARLLAALQARFPNLRFASDAEFLSAWRGRTDGWFREPTQMEQAERIRHYLLELSGARTISESEEQWGRTELHARRTTALATELSTELVGSEGNASPERSAITNRLGGQTFLVFLGSIFTLIVGFPLQIYVSRSLGADGLGTFALIEGVVATLSGFLGFGIAQAAVRFVPFHLAQHDYASVRAIIRYGASILLAVGIFAYLVVLGSLALIGEGWPNLVPHKAVVSLMAAMIPLGLIMYLLQQGLRGFHEIKYMVMGSSVVQLVIKAGTAVILLSLGWGLFGYGLAVVTSTTCAVLWMGLGLRRRMREMPAGTARVSQSNWNQWHRYAMVAYLGGLLSFTAYSDRFILGYFVGPAAVGIFLIARQLQLMPGMFNQMLIMVGAPMFAAAHSRNSAAERQHIYTLMTDWVVRASLPVLIFLVVFGQPVLRLFGQGFAAGGEIVLLILVGAQFVNLAYGPVGNLAMMSGLERYGLRLNAITTCVGLALEVLLVPFFGLVGAAVASAAAWVLMNASLLRAIQSHLGIRWYDPRFRGWLLPSVAMAFVGLAVRESGIDMDAVKLVVILAVMYAVFFIVNVAQGLHRDDKELLRHLRVEFLRWRFA
jgi:O-antigen/teichoic acid export membrane protein